MPFNSPGDSTLQWGMGRGLLFPLKNDAGVLEYCVTFSYLDFILVMMLR